MKSKWKCAGLRAGLLMTTVLWMSAFPVYAEKAEKKAGIDMSTAYPGISVKAGQTVNFSLDFVSEDGQNYEVVLSEISLPEKWDGYFKGKSNEVSMVHVAGNTMKDAKVGSGLVSYNLTVPADAKEGTYSVKLGAEAGQMSDELELNVTVSAQENGMSDFETTYAQQQGPSGSVFKFDTTIVNNRAIGQSYALAAEAPDGWQVTFTPTGESASVTTMDVDAEASKGMAVKITPPQVIEKGEYVIPCTAISANDKLTTELTVNITGSYSVTMSTADGRLSLDAYANKPSTVVLEVTNNGNVNLKNLNLTSKMPSGWDISFSESTIEELEAGATKEITATVTPGSDVITGDYVSGVTIKNSIVSNEIAFRISIKTPTTWGYAAVAVVVVILMALAGIVKKFGRR